MQDLVLAYDFMLVVLVLQWLLLLIFSRHLRHRRRIYLVFGLFTLRILYRFFLLLNPLPGTVPVGKADLIVDLILGIAVAQLFLLHHLDRLNLYARGMLYRLFLHRFSVVLTGVVLFLLVYLVSPLSRAPEALQTFVGLASFYEFTVYLAVFALILMIARQIPSIIWRVILYTGTGILALAPLIYGIGLLWNIPLLPLQTAQSLLYLFGYTILAVYLQDPGRLMLLDRLLMETGRQRILTPALKTLLLQEEEARRAQELETFDLDRYLEGYREGDWLRVLEPVARYLLRDFPEATAYVGKVLPDQRRVTFTHRIDPQAGEPVPLVPPETLDLPQAPEPVPRFYLTQEIRGQEDGKSPLFGKVGGFSVPFALGPERYLLWIPCDPELRGLLHSRLQQVQGRVQQWLSFAYDHLKTQEIQRIEARMTAVFQDTLRFPHLDAYLESLGFVLETVFPTFAVLSLEGSEVRFQLGRGASPDLWNQLVETLDVYQLRRWVSVPLEFHEIPGLPGQWAFASLSDRLLLAVYRDSSEPGAPVDRIRQDYFREQVLPTLQRHIRETLQYVQERKILWLSRQFGEIITWKASATLEEVARAILETARQIGGYPGASLFLVDQENPQRVEHLATDPPHLLPESAGRLDLRSSPALLSVSATLQPSIAPEAADGDLLAQIFGFRAWAVFPLQLENTLLGFLVLHAPYPHQPPGDFQLRMLEQFAQFTAYVMFWVLTRHRQQAQEQSISKFLDALTELLQVTNEDDLHQKLVDIVQDLMEADAASFMLFHPETQEFTIVAARGLSQEYVEGQHIPVERLRVLLGNGYAPVYTRNLQETYYGNPELIRQEDLRSALSMFIRKEGEIYGILNVYSKGEIRRFSGAKRQVFSYLGVLASTLLESLHLYNAALRQSRLLENLNTFGRAIIRYLNTPEASWHDLLAVMADMFNSETLYLIRERPEQWVEVHEYRRREQAYRQEVHDPATLVERFPDLPDTQTLVQEGLVSTDPQTYTLYLSQVDNDHWILRVERPFFESPDFFLNLLQGVSDLLRLGLIGMTHFENERRRSQDIALINQMLRALFAAEDLEATLRDILETLRNRLNATWIALVDPRRSAEEAFRVAIPEEEHVQMTTALKQHREALLRALRRKQVLQVRHRDRFRIGVPLEAHHGHRGLLFLELPSRHFDPRYTLSFLETLASEFAAVLENVELSRQAQETLKRLESTQSQLVESSKLAAIGTLAAGVAHEIKNPLFIIQGMMDLWRRQVHPRVRPEEIQQIQDAVYRINKIVGSLLDYARSSQETALETVYLNETIESALEIMRRTYAKEGIHVELHLDRSLPPLQAKRGELMQVISNLVQNARDAIRHSNKGDTILVTTKFYPQEAEVEITVWDNGPGIPKELQTRIFEPFFTTKPAGQGTGLGLSIVKRLVEEMGGRIELESEEGQFTRFTVRFPFRPATATETPSPRLSPEDLELFKGKRVLVVDDERSITEIVKRYLTEMGCQVTCFNDPKAARNRAIFDRFDILLLDIRLGGEISGFDIYEDLLKRNPHNAQRVVFLTGGIGDQSIRTYLETHQLRYITKPISLDRLLEALLPYVKGESPPEGSPPASDNPQSSGPQEGKTDSGPNGSSVS